jgi:hypothetical protein
MSVAEQMEALLNGASMDDLQDMLEASFEKLRDTLPDMKERRASMEGEEAEKMDEAIASTERILAQFDAMRAEAIRAARESQ